MGLPLLSGLRDSSLHTVAQDFAFDGSARTWSKAGKNLRQRKRCNEWEREGGVEYGSLKGRAPIFSRNDDHNELIAIFVL